MIYRFICSAFLILLLCNSCTSDKRSEVEAELQKTLTAANPLMELLSPETSGIQFSNNITETFEDNILNNIFIYNGGGVGIGDFNKDGLQDVYFVKTYGANALYINKNEMTFEDVAKSAGVESIDGFETAVTVVDINADGWQDIYLCRAGKKEGDIRRNKLFVNQGIGENGHISFLEQAKTYGLDAICRSTGATFFDYDKDGDLDCYLLNYPTADKWTLQIDSKLQPDGSYKANNIPKTAFDSDRLYRNEKQVDGSCKFVNVTETAGLTNFAYGLSVSVTDFNRDGWPDLYVGNDFIHPDFMYINNGDGTFRDELRTKVKHTSQHTMGTDLIDFNNDGLVDVFGVDMYPPSNYRKKTLKTTNAQSFNTALLKNGYFEPVVRNVLQKNNGDGTFQDVAYGSGIAETDWSWSGLFFDMDNDGMRDLHITNGYRREISRFDVSEFVIPDILKNYQKGQSLKEQFGTIGEFLKLIDTLKINNHCYQNKGRFEFEQKMGDWMTVPPSWSCGSAWVDLDKDGDLDLVVNNMVDPAFLYENKANEKKENNFLQVSFEGMPDNPFGIGASVGIYYGKNVQMYENFTNRGIFSSVEPLAHFGLGKHSTPVRVVVRWPDGKAKSYDSVLPNQRLIAKYTDAAQSIDFVPLPRVASSIFEQVNTESIGLAFTHIENDYNDFEQWPMHMWSLTDIGPYLAKADINGDGTQDVFISGGPNQASKLFIQSKNGQFTSILEDVLAKSAAYEDHGALFLDVDLDKDMDLIVCSGGAEYDKQNAWTLRMYLNSDGKGAYIPLESSTIFPELESVPSRITTGDFDLDGDLDLIVAGRSLFGEKWPTTPKTYVLRNDRTKFVDVTKEVAPELEYAGMISDLVFANLDGTGLPELVVMGEMMPIKVFRVENGTFKEATEEFGLQNSNGLWNRVLPVDVDKDGDIDLVAGNFGVNSRLKASPEAPIICYAGDFDNNGTIDPILTLHENGEQFPYLIKSVLTKQMPFLRKKYNFSNDYALASIEDLVPSEQFSACQKLKINYLESGVWLNSNNQMTFVPFPIEAQLAPVNGMISTDFNGDGMPDLLLSGNKHNMEVETGPQDAGVGTMLIGDGKGGYLWADNRVSGFWATKEARDLLAVKDAVSGSLIILTANNNGPLEVSRPKKQGSN